MSAFGLTYDEFLTLDEKPGYISANGKDYAQCEWPRRLRIVRNDPGNDLFDRLKR